MLIWILKETERGKMRKYGFKLFSSNLRTAPELIGECAGYAADRDDMFIELMVVPDCTEDDLRVLKKQIGGVEVRIHAPHNDMGFDAGNAELERQNKTVLSMSQKAADIFAAKTIVVHAGCGRGREYVEETARQFKSFDDKRIVVENLPCAASNGDILHGTTPDEIKYIMRESGCGFCFDFSHAICAAVGLKLDVEDQLKGFYNLKPDVYHMCDGDFAGDIDSHMHFGDGNYPLKRFLETLTDENAYITMETGKGISQHNDLWVKDYDYLKSLSVN